MKTLKIFLLTLGIGLSVLGAQGQASAPTISLAPGTYTGVQMGVKVSSANGGTNIIACTIDGATPATNGAGTSAASDGHSFTLRNPGWLPIGATSTLKCVAGTSLVADSSVTSAAYVINKPNAIATDAEGAQCQANAINCPSYTFTSTFPNRFRIWDAASPFYSEIPGQKGSNTDWASIESDPTSPGTYGWTALDNWLDAIHARRLLQPNLTAVYTFGMIPRAQVVTGIPGGTVGFNVTSLAVVDGTTLTLGGSFGAVNFSNLYIQLTGMAAGNNIPLTAAGVGQGALVTGGWGASSITVAVASTAGFSNQPSATGTLKIVPGPKGMSIHPDDLPLQGGTTNWNGVPPSPGCSTSFHNFVVALVNHCSAAAHCFSKEVNGIEGWNEPNNNFFWNPNLNSLPQITQMLECEMPTIRNVMDGTGGTNKVFIQSPATTASAPVTLQYMNWEVTNGRYSDVEAYHHYFANANPSVAPETIISVETNMAGNRASSLGWANTPVRDTETGFEATQNPYGCTQGSPWTATDCYGQIVRYQFLAASAGVTSVDWYNLAVNCLNNFNCALNYSTMATLFNGGTIGSCTNAGSSPHVIYQCPFTEANGATALFVWNYCLNDANYASCSTNGSTFAIPAGYNNVKDLNGGSTGVTAGNNFTVTVLPVMFEQLGITQAPSTPFLLIQ